MDSNKQPEVFCKDCRHNRAGPIARFLNFTPLWTCAIDPRPAKTDLVTGGKGPAGFYYCSSTRIDSTVCGPAGRAWQPRDKKDLFKYIKHVKG